MFHNIFNYHPDINNGLHIMIRINLNLVFNLVMSKEILSRGNENVEYTISSYN